MWAEEMMVVWRCEDGRGRQSGSGAFLLVMILVRVWFVFLLLVEVEGLLGFCTLDAGSMSRATVRTAKRALIGRVIVRCGQQEPGRRSGDDDLRASTGEANISTVALPFPASVVMSLGHLSIWHCYAS